MHTTRKQLPLDFVNPLRFDNFNPVFSGIFNPVFRVFFNRVSQPIFNPVALCLPLQDGTTWDENMKKEYKLAGLTRRQLIGGGSLILLAGCSNWVDKSAKTSAIAVNKQGEVLTQSPPMAPPTPPQASDGAFQFDLSEAMTKLNAIRKREGLDPFKNDPRLQKAAQAYADKMAREGKYGHEIGPGTDFQTRIKAVGYDNTSGENLGVGYNSIDAALIGWLDSPDHKQNMFKPHYTVAGLGYAYNNSGKNPQYTHLWVLMMGVNDGKYGF